MKDKKPYDVLRSIARFMEVVGWTIMPGTVLAAYFYFAFSEAHENPAGVLDILICGIILGFAMVALGQLFQCIVQIGRDVRGIAEAQG